MTEESNKTAEKKPFYGAENFIYGLAVVILPLIVIILFILRTIQIVESPALTLALNFWILVTTFFLLVCKNLPKETKLAVEWSAFIAAAATFIATLVISTF